MLLKTNCLDKYPNLTEGTSVRSQDGEKLGKISAMNEDSFTVQKGFFFPKDFMFRYDDIEDFREGELVVNRSHQELSEWKDTSHPGWTQVSDINEGKLQATPRPEFKDRYAERVNEEKLQATPAPELKDRYAERGNEDIRVPVVEEELNAQKTVRQAGEIHLRKVVHTELKHFTVPVMKEEIRIEHVPVTERLATEAGALKSEAAFQEKTINVPVMEEEVTVIKRPVVKEEVRVHKERTFEQRDVSGEIKKEEVQVEGQEALQKKKKIA